MVKPANTPLSFATVSNSYYDAAYQFAQQLVAEKSLAGHWLEVHAPSTTDERIPASRYQHLLDSAAIELDEPCFGLKYGQQIDIARFSLLGYLAMASATLEEASKAVTQFGGLVSGIGQLESEIVDVTVDANKQSLVKVYWRPKVGNESYSPQVVDGVLAGWANFGRRFVNEKVSIHSVHLTYRTADHSTYEDYFGCPVFLDSAENYICIEKQFFERSLCQAEPLVHKIIQERANQAILEVKEQTLLASSYIKQVLPNLILAHNANIEHIAKLLNTSPRSLQRKLAQEGISFSHLLDQAKHSLALALLSERKYSISHISGMIGFNDQSSFTRACKRWLGMTPKQYQELD